MEYSIDKVVITDPYYRLRAKSLARIHAFPAELLEDACEKKGFSEIHKIVWGISYEDLDTKVRACPEALDRQDSYGYTPLDYAVRFGKRNHVRVLLSHGADVGSRPHSLLLIALEFGEYASIRLLVDRGLRLNELRLYAQDDEDNDGACLSDDSPVRYSRRWNGYCNSASYVMDNYLTDYAFDFKIGAPDGITVLMSLCRRPSSPKVAKQMTALLKHGVDLEVTDDYGQTAIHHTLYSDNLLALEMLIEYGVRLGARTSKGETVLHMAARMTERVAMVRALSNAGIMQLDLNAPLCYRGDTAFDVLKRRAAETKPFCWDWDFPQSPENKVHAENQIQVIRALETLFQEIQEHQGVPLKDRYPALHIAAPGEPRTAEPVDDACPASSDHAVHGATDVNDIPANRDSIKSICAPPGAWPE